MVTALVAFIVLAIGSATTCVTLYLRSEFYKGRAEMYGRRIDELILEAKNSNNAVCDLMKLKNDQRDRAKAAERERDEARAELDRLKATLRELGK
jgi:hypothetical protein